MTHDELYMCERCGELGPYERLQWVRRQPEDEAPTWAICGRCEERVACVCSGKGCQWCGRRAARTERRRWRHERKQRRRLLELEATEGRLP